MPDIGVTCATCPYFSQADENIGVCRFEPPKVFIVSGPPDLSGKPTLQTPSLWPAIKPDNWCGKHPLFMHSISMPLDSRLAGKAEGEA